MFLLNSLKNITVTISDSINKVAKITAVIFLAVLVSIVLLQIVFRYILNLGLPWVDELSRFLNIWIGFLGASIGFKYGEHVGVAFFVEKLPEKKLRIFNFVTKLISLALFIFVIYYSFGFIVDSRSLTPAMNLSYKWPKSSLFIGFSIIGIHLVSFILTDIVDFMNGNFSIAKSNNS
ncbi:TRAP transporter small permease subunit [Iocasia frigidifontis]|uniref:TRAP transporter small permease subunit n=1 Tax=Iocasia fonsfrigidae TaxID=2682810 RepID=A0A8A7K5W9_9FIRM|nr:TRAP transporter small permease subunit [Iocasia fonsfrigidae]QTL96711.1 TRAP transporter small permease subunit [Iocasia fonsfrigidae]